MQKKTGIAAIVLSLLLLAGCGQTGDGAKYKEDPDADALAVFLTFDEDGDAYYAKNAMGEGRYLVNSLRNDVSDNKFFEDTKPAYRTEGVSGKSLSFDGYTTNIELGNPLYGQHEFTIDLWMAIRAYDFVDATRNITPLVEYYDKATDSGFIFGYTFHGKWGVRLSTSAGQWTEVWADDSLDLFKWHNLSVTYDGKEVILFYNGEEVKASNVHFSGFTADASAVLGRNTFCQSATYGIFENNCFAGLMDEFKIYKKALTHEAIEKNAERYLQNDAPPAIDYKEMNYPYDYLSDNLYRTQWHGAPPVNWVSDINGGFYYNGKYHIFYTKSDLGPQLGGVAWGHMVSDDMIGWSEVQPAIWCEDNGIDSRWVFAGSGGVVNDVPYIFYTGFILNAANRFVCTVGMATPEDLSDPELTHWKKVEEVQLRLPSSGYNTDEYRDPQIYIEGDTVFLIIVSKTAEGNPCIVGWSANVNNMTEWTWRGTIFEVNYSVYQDSGTMWEVPIFLKLTSPDKQITKWILAFAPIGAATESNDSIYFCGTFDAASCRFTPDAYEIKRFDQGEKYFMCSGGEIYDPISDRTVVFELIQCCWNLTDSMRYQSGYSGVLSMGRVYGINNKGELTVSPIGGYEKLHGEKKLSLTDVSPSQTERAFEVGRSFHLHAVADPLTEESKMGFELLSSKSGTESLSFYYDIPHGNFAISTLKTSNSAQKYTSYYSYKLGEKETVIDIYADRSSVEIFVNGDFAMSARVYNNIFCDYIRLIGDDWYLHELTVYEMNSIWK